MTTHLHWAVAGVYDRHLEALGARIDVDIATAVKDFAGNHAIG